MTKRLEEMTNEELAREEYMACMIADDLMHEYASKEEEFEIDPDTYVWQEVEEADNYVMEVHREIERRGLKAITVNNFTVLVPRD